MKEILKSLNQKPIAYYPIYRQVTGSTTSAILLSQLMYWFSIKNKFYKTDKEIRNETLLTERELKTAKQKIKKIEFIEVTREDVPAKTYYKINWDKYYQIMNEFCIKNEQTKWDEKDKLNGTNRPNCEGQIVPTTTIILENTTENTTEKSSDKFFNSKKEFIYFKDDEVNNIMTEYLNFRKSKKLSNSNTVIKRLINKLKNFYDKGHKPKEIVENALTNGWKDFYEPKINNNNIRDDEAFIRSAKKHIDDFVKGDF